MSRGVAYLTSDLSLTVSKMNLIILHVISYLTSALGGSCLGYLCVHLRAAVNKYLLAN